jgi:hypothetical protein
VEASHAEDPNGNTYTDDTDAYTDAADHAADAIIIAV